MNIEEIIPAEIINDGFYARLLEITKRPDLHTFLEIGSSSGAGSTLAIVNGILSKNLQSSTLFCLEVSKTRYSKLVEAYKAYPFVVSYNLSSVKLCEFPSAEQVRLFYNRFTTTLNRFTLKQVLDWLQQDLDHIERNRLDFCGIDFIKSSNNIDYFDFVLIDGSEFTGEAELQHVWGAKIIALDDVNAFKSYSAYIRLINHYLYKLIYQDLTLRNGYAIFERLT